MSKEKIYVVDGIKGTIAQLSRHFGVDHRTVYWRMNYRSKKMSIEEALKTPTEKSKGAGRPSKKFLYKGQMLSVPEIAKSEDIPVSRLYYRLRRYDNNMEKALGEGGRRQKKEPFHHSQTSFYGSLFDLTTESFESLVYILNSHLRDEGSINRILKSLDVYGLVKDGNVNRINPKTSKVIQKIMTGDAPDVTFFPQMKKWARAAEFKRELDQTPKVESSSIERLYGEGPYIAFIASGERLVNLCNEESYDSIGFEDPSELGQIFVRKFKSEKEKIAYLKGLHDGEELMPTHVISEEVYKKLTLWRPLDGIALMVSDVHRSLPDGEEREKLGRALQWIKDM